VHLYLEQCRGVWQLLSLSAYYCSRESYLTDWDPSDAYALALLVYFSCRSAACPVWQHLSHALQLFSRVLGVLCWGPSLIVPMVFPYLLLLLAVP
jgi:hypothetical protein